MARPAKADHERRTAQLPAARVTVAEFIAAQAKADAAGLSVSDLIRQLVTVGRAAPPRRLGRDDRLLVELNRAGNNLNQIAKRLNAGGSVPADFGHVLHQFHTVLEKIGRAYGA